jgi:hypothetical protein
MSAESLPE